MTSGFEAAMNAMLADLKQQQEDLVRLQTGLTDVTGTATAPKQQLSVTVDAKGGLTEVKFHGNGFRKMAAEELASLIVETTREAQQDARRALRDRVGDVGPAGADLGTLVDGEIDWSAAFADTFSLPQPLLDLLGAPPATGLFPTTGTSGQADGGADPAGDGPHPPRRD